MGCSTLYGNVLKGAYLRDIRVNEAGFMEIGFYGENCPINTDEGKKRSRVFCNMSAVTGLSATNALFDNEDLSGGSARQCSWAQ